MWNGIFVVVFLLGACGSDNSKSVDSNEQARRAYLGLDKSISKSLALAFAGYDAASNANIPTETAMGDATGTLTITGKVDKGNISQLSMSLGQAMAKYSDGKFIYDAPKSDMIAITYDTTADATQPSLSLKLNGSAGNTINGTLVGDYTMTGDLQGTVTLDVMLSGTFSGSGNTIMRVVGSTHVTGTAANSSGGMYTIDVML
jgi:hypothetical protein